MERAQETIVNIETYITLGHYHTAVSRMYYACYYAVTAMLLHKGVEVKSHSGARQMLSLHYIKVGLFSKQLSEFYQDLHDARNEGDYEEFQYFEQEEIEILYAQSIELVNAAAAILKQL
jgi:uncharacterized protein (UPF0332 family)